ncbi:unnamed protein product [Blepharisma stoltei]|uniref:Uncharacterized protein n=1 Tax=Blepharisma stoltei TaxID=1481888 RepID=A0AAU9J424_9CILI|nr:unnamed protein product [Blepharisma stoltei]
MASAIRNKKGLIIGASYTNDEVRRPIQTRVVVEKVESLPGSIAGAGSGDFHQYRNLRRREEARQDLLEVNHREQKIAEEFQALREYHRKTVEEKAKKKAMKRKKKKERKQLKIQELKLKQKGKTNEKTENEWEEKGQAIKQRKIEESDNII